MAFSQPSEKFAYQHYLSHMGQSAYKSGSEGCTPARPAAQLRQFSREFGMLAVRGAENTRTPEPQGDHALRAPCAGIASAGGQYGWGEDWQDEKVCLTENLSIYQTEFYNLSNGNIKV